ncbi:hypothetical protein NLK74_19660, partial [Escherichia coli]|nr:hypothetical protein [Escherichia coli]MCU6529242.1 hypothetical protein [Escherichia coli]
MDITPFLHALCAVAAQLLIGLFTGNWAYGAIAGCTFFIAREHTQAEYRWIEMFGHGKRMNMNRPGFPGECFICELRLPDHRFRWKHNKLFLLLP